MIGLHTTCY